MYAVSTINKINAEAAAKAKAEASPSSSFNQRPNGDVLVSWHPAGQRRSSKTLTGEAAASFLSSVKLATTKTGKVPQRTLDRLIHDIVAPAPVFEVGVNPYTGQVTIAKRRDHDILGRKTLGPRVSKRFQAELASITVSPDRAPKKYKAAVSSLASTYYGG